MKKKSWSKMTESERKEAREKKTLHIKAVAKGIAALPPEGRLAVLKPSAHLMTNAVAVARYTSTAMVN
jgi:hypothetical protein